MDGLVTTRQRGLRGAARFSLIALWLITAAASLIELDGRSRELLVAAGTPAAWIAPVIVAGALVDVLIGLALWRWDQRWVYWVAGAMMLLMTLVATVILPSLWLDPLGGLTKNLPVGMLLLMLEREQP